MEWYQNVHECEIDFYAYELNTIKRWTKDSAAESERAKRIHSCREALTVCFVPTSGSIENRSNIFDYTQREWEQQRLAWKQYKTANTDNIKRSTILFLFSSLLSNFQQTFHINRNNQRKEQEFRSFSTFIGEFRSLSLSLPLYQNNEMRSKWSGCSMASCNE